METLEKNWFYKNLVDFEYKKYTLLAYLQHVEERFKTWKLYPPFADLIEHYRNLQFFIKNNEILESQFPKKLENINLKDLKLDYEIYKPDDQVMEEIKKIVEFSKTEIEYYLKEGKKLYESIQSNLYFEAIGVVPIYKNEGFILVQNGEKDLINSYRYELKLFENAYDQFRAINTSYVGTFELGFRVSYIHVKRKLIEENKELPNPATFLFKTKWEIPEQESVLPIIKRDLLQKLIA